MYFRLSNYNTCTIKYEAKGKKLKYNTTVFKELAYYIPMFD